MNYGIMSPEELLQCASAMGIKRMVLTDINNTSGCLDFLRLAPNPPYKIAVSVGVDFRRDNKQLFIAIAQNNQGFKEINDYLSIYRTAHTDIPDTIPYLPNCFIIHPWHKGKSVALGANEYIGIHPDDVTAFRLFGKQYPNDKHVMLATATFRNKKDFNTHRLLRAIDNNELLSRLPKEQEGRSTDTLKPMQKLIDAFDELPHAVTNA
ncbi:MAG: PHP domain-containing protein, partial [Bacteroidetes bacterium]|nr:PHP domain-containing protein [Bacteroidota bacterium]